MTFGIGKIYYALESPIDGATKLLPQYFEKEEYSIGYNIPEVCGGILRKESIALFQEFSSINPTGGLSEWTKLLIKTIE